MERLEPGEGYEGAKRERGFLPIENTGEGLFKGLPSEVTVWHYHCDEVKELPDGFQANRFERDLSDSGDAAERATPLRRSVSSRAV